LNEPAVLYARYVATFEQLHAANEAGATQQILHLCAALYRLPDEQRVAALLALDDVARCSAPRSLDQVERLVLAR
jgi:hypothetical protein